jgi:hypothetical protein
VNRLDYGSYTICILLGRLKSHGLTRNDVEIILLDRAIFMCERMSE